MLPVAIRLAMHDANFLSNVMCMYQMLLDSSSSPQSESSYDIDYVIDRVVAVSNRKLARYAQLAYSFVGNWNLNLDTYRTLAKYFVNINDFQKCERCLLRAIVEHQDIDSTDLVANILPNASMQANFFQNAFRVLPRCMHSKLYYQHACVFYQKYRELQSNFYFPNQNFYGNQNSQDAQATENSENESAKNESARNEMEKNADIENAIRCLEYCLQLETHFKRKMDNDHIYKLHCLGVWCERHVKRTLEARKHYYFAFLFLTRARRKTLSSRDWMVVYDYLELEKVLQKQPQSSSLFLLNHNNGTSSYNNGTFHTCNVRALASYVKDRFQFNCVFDKDSFSRFEKSLQ